MTKFLNESSSTETSIGKLQIQKIVAGAIKNRKSFAFWRKQGQLQLHGIVDLADSPVLDKSDLEDSKPGFLVSPFHNEHRSKNIRINADLVFRQTEEDSFFTMEPHPGVMSEQVDAFIGSALNTNVLEKVPDYFPPSIQTENSKEGATFLATVDRAVQAIKRGDFSKVVPSRYSDILYPQGWDFVESFATLSRLYPNAFVYLFGIPGVGTWMGATPELLISITDKRWFKSVALAGTQKLPESGEISQVAWTQKEIEEQALVARYIINCFKKIRLREYEEKGPKTIKAGNLAHLKTEFYVDIESVNFPQLGTVMLDLLHPTSAVCGMPLQPSLDFLKENEGYDREFFSGYLGPVNMNSETQLFVNLRSMKLFSDKARLFAGAGVTEDSIPEKEWEETELKFQTLKRLFEER